MISQGIFLLATHYLRDVLCFLLSPIFPSKIFFMLLPMWRQHESRKRKCLGTMMRWWSPLLNPNSFKFNLNKKLIIQKRHLIIFSNVLIKWIFILEHRKKFIEWLFRISNFFIFFNDSASKTTTTTIFFSNTVLL